MSFSHPAPDSFVPIRREGVSETEIDGELVLLDTSTGALHVLNRIGTAVWAELDGQRDVEAIIADLSDAAGADVERVREDVMDFLGQLGKGGLLAETLPATSPSRGHEPGRLEEPADDRGSAGA
jgi:Coenzyme PQQ synthesis protein D (PqqD)